MEVLDRLNAKDGKGILYFAGQGIQTAMTDEEGNVVTLLYDEIQRFIAGEVNKKARISGPS
ncbi:hypothetical protein U0026_13590 [Kluyvera intermedia]|jgi:hypothetical protein|nr:hypothetical protein [Kluyvera intermedia]WQD28095.1 hypothetical protein U0026_13590 [Kluyvera intermedia]VDZ83646.1 DNA polymerase V subunit UmuC [Kluyvera intermedia]